MKTTVSLFDPVRLGTMEVGNRIVMAPMHMGLASPDGGVTEKLAEHYVRRAEGLGLLVVEATAVSARSLWPHLLRADSDAYLGGLASLANMIHATGSLVALQLMHLGGVADAGASGVGAKAPSAVPHPGPLGKNRPVPDPMTVEDIERVVEDFAQAARRAAEADFDAVEVHACHGSLFSQFLSPLTNQRSDLYGGQIAHRARLCVQVVQRVKKILGDQRPLLCRLGVEDLLPGGLSLADGLFTAAMIAEAGVDVIDVSGGLCGHLHPFVAGPGFFAPQAEAVKRAVHVPVIAVGGVKTPQHAEEIVHSGRADLVAVGRAILSDPDWAARAGHRSSGDSGRSAGGC